MYIHNIIKKTLYFIVFAIIVLYVFVYITRWNQDRFFTLDFTSYYNGATIILSGENPYSIDLQLIYQNILIDKPNNNYLLPFMGTIITALLYAPLTTFDIKTSYWVFSIISIILLIIILKRLNKTKNIPILLIFLPVLTSVYLGQPTVFILAGLTLTYHLYNNGKYFESGLSSILAYIKPQYLLIYILLFIVFQKKYFLFGLIVAFLIFLSVSVFFLGLNFIPDYFRFILYTDSGEFGTNPEQIKSIQYTLMSVFSKELSIFISVALLISLIVLVYANQKRMNINNIVSICITIGVLFAYHVNSHDLILLLLPLSLQLNTLHQIKNTDNFKLTNKLNLLTYQNIALFTIIFLTLFSQFRTLSVIYLLFYIAIHIRMAIK